MYGRLSGDDWTSRPIADCSLKIQLRSLGQCQASQFHLGRSTSPPPTRRRPPRGGPRKRWKEEGQVAQLLMLVARYLAPYASDILRLCRVLMMMCLFVTLLWAKIALCSLCSLQKIVTIWSNLFRPLDALNYNCLYNPPYLLMFVRHVPPLRSLSPNS